MKRGWFGHIDWWLVSPIGILIFLSLTILFSLDKSFFINQLVFVIVSSLVFLFFTQVNIENIAELSIPLYALSVISLIIVFAVGIHTRGAIRWIPLLGFQLQFSEILKPVLIFCFACFLNARKDIGWKTLLWSVGLLFPILYLIYRQPDLGSALIYGTVFMLICLVYGFPWWWFGSFGMVALLSIPFLNRFLHDYQKQRLMTFLHMSKDPLGSSYNAIQATIAVGSGMVIGKGVGLGTQSSLRFLPERHTDFLFASLSEDLGFLGAILVLSTFVILLVRMYLIYTKVLGKTEKVFVTGAFFLMLTQVFVNIGMNIGLLPIVGVTLPFMSYGGSSLLSNAVLMGIVSGVAKKRVYNTSLEIT